MAGNPKKLTAIDICRYPQWEELIKIAAKAEINLNLIVSDDSKIELEETDLLFIDSLHTYSHVLLLLRKHHTKVKKYIVLHDIYESNGEVAPCKTSKDLYKAVSEFLADNGDMWAETKKHHPCGLFILERKM